MIINMVTLMHWISFIIYMSIIILYICIWVLGIIYMGSAGKNF